MLKKIYIESILLIFILLIVFLHINSELSSNPIIKDGAGICSSDLSDSKIIAYVPVYIHNQELIETKTNLQILLNINWSRYYCFLNSNVSNVRFFNSTKFSYSNLLPGWIESNDSSSSTSSLVWINLKNTIINPESTTTVYMSFLEPNTNFSQNWGVAPNLSPKYGYGDNGADVFQYYNNFSNSSIENIWCTFGNHGNITVSNGLTLTSGCGWWGIKSPYVVSSGMQIIFGIKALTNYTVAGVGTFNGAIFDLRLLDNPKNWGIEPTSNGSFFNGNRGGLSTDNKFYEMDGIYNSGSQSLINGFNEIESLNSLRVNSSNLIIAQFYGYPVYIPWVAVGISPPNGVMPSSFYGSLHIKQYKIIFYKDQTSNGSTWWVNLSGVNTSSSFNNIIQYRPNGTYSYTSGTYVNGTSTIITGQMSIKGKNVTVYLQFQIIQKNFNSYNKLGKEEFIDIILLLATIIGLIIIIERKTRKAFKSYFHKSLNNLTQRLVFIIKRSKPKFVIPSIVIFSIVVLIYYKFIMFNGYISGGNYGTPLHLSFYSNFFPSSFTWSQNSSYGSPVLSPWVSILDSTYQPILLLFGGFYNPNVAMKIFILFTTFIFSFSFYLLLSRFVFSPWIRLVSVIFLLLNPVTLQYIMQGLNTSFLWISIYFLSLYLLSRGIQTLTKLRYVNFLSSALLLALSAGDPSAWYLEVPLYFIFYIYFNWFNINSSYNITFIKSLKDLVFIFAAILIFLFPLIITSIYSSYNISPESALAKPLIGYVDYSATFWNMLILNSNPAYSLITITHPHLLTIFWVASIYLLVIIILPSGFLLKDKRLIFITLIIIIAALLGSGYYSPISKFDIYMYENFPGFQLLNDAYLWDWAIISPLYAIEIALLIERMLNRPLIDHKTNKTIFSKTYKVLRDLVLRFKRKGITFMIFVLIVLIGFIPIFDQSYYGSNGLHQSEMPSDYYSLNNELNKLVGNTENGVAIFPPSFGILFGNASGGSVDPLLLNSKIRFALPQGYSSTPAPSNYYFYWAYQMFYNNETDNIAQIMGIMGVKYFVTLNDVNHNGNEVTNLMRYQHNLSLITTNENFSIYKSNINVTLGGEINKITLLTGEFNSIQRATSLGIDLANSALVLGSDLNSSNFNIILNNTKLILISNNQGLLPIAISKYVSSQNEVNLLNYTSHYASNLNSNWLQTNVLYSYPESLPYQSIDSSPTPFIVTYSNKSLVIPLGPAELGNETVWVKIYNSPQKDSSLNFTIDNNSTLVNTYLPSYNSSFRWIRIPYYQVSSLVYLKVKGKGFNGISEVIVTHRNVISNELNFLNGLIKMKNITLIYLNQTADKHLNDSALADLSLNLTSKIDIGESSDSYKISGSLYGLIYVKMNYFSSVKPIYGNVQIVPVLGGSSYIILNRNNITQLTFRPTEYYPFILGLDIFSISSIILIIITITLILLESPSKKIFFKK